MSAFTQAVSLLSDPAVPGRLAGLPALVGFDGFVDTILHVVAQRHSATEYTRMTETAAFAKRVGNAAGLSANFEFITHMVKLGGNGPIMANALGSFGAPITYIGNIGSPGIHPMFADFAGHCERVISIAEPALTDAIEFEDSKLMCGKHEPLKLITWENILRHASLPELREIFCRSALVAMVNWTMIMHSTDIFRSVLRDIAPSVAASGRPKAWMFFDLADPSKRTAEDIAELLRVISEFQHTFKVMLGLNLPESRQIGSVLGLKEPEELYGPVTDFAARIRQKLQIETLVIHATQFASGAGPAGSAYVLGPYTPKPVITTGAGDHFNAGFCLGQLLGGAITESLQLGVATSGFYVRQARSPSLGDLINFLRTI